MMLFGEWVAKPETALVMDASVVINLLATGWSKEILRAIPNSVLVVDTVRTELENGRQRGRQESDHLDQLISAKLVKVVDLGDVAEAVFEKLVIGPSQSTLDDGEAATIAFAVELGAAALIDERKAIRLCSTRFSRLLLDCSVGLLAHPNVFDRLGQESLSEAVFNALQFARMRVLPEYAKWVVDLIGPERAASCPSLQRSLRMHNV